MSWQDMPLCFKTFFFELYSLLCKLSRVRYIKLCKSFRMIGLLLFSNALQIKKSIKSLVESHIKIFYCRQNFNQNFIHSLPA